MKNQQLINLFSRALGVDCNVVDTDNFCNIEIERDQISNEFLPSCQNFLSRYEIETVIASQQSSDVPVVIQCNKSSSKKFEEKLESLYKAIQLHEMARSGNLKTLEELLSQEMDVDTTNISSETPLISAAYTSAYINTYTVKFLLENGANINHQDQGGATALHIAVSNADFSLAEILLGYGVDATIATSKGVTALQIAVEAGDGKMIEMLSKYCNKQPIALTEPTSQITLGEAVGGGEVTAQNGNITQFFSQSANDSAEQRLEEQLAAVNLGK